MKTQRTSDLTKAKTIEELARDVQALIDELQQIVSGGLEFSKNLRGQFVEVRFIGANNEVQVRHGLTRKPTGYLVVRRSADFRVIDGFSQNTTELLKLRATQAGTCTIFVF